MTDEDWEMVEKISASGTKQHMGMNIAFVKITYHIPRTFTNIKVNLENNASKLHPNKK